MKKILLICQACLMAVSLFAQTSTTVYTPKGTAVPATIYNEFTASQITQVNNDAATQYPNATRIADASAQYNCHAYAWHLTEGKTNRVWINTPGDDKYWQDGSFIRVCNEADGKKVSYPNGDHSAIRSAQSIPLGRYDSKWGNGPVMRHTPTYSPYNSTGLQYYVSTAINGPSTVCSSVSFSAAAITGATYTWSKSSNIVLTGSGNAIQANAVSGASGSGWIQVIINSPCGGSVTTRKNVTVGSSITMSWNGTGPYGQVDVNVNGGSAPYKFYRDNTLIHTSYSNPTTVPFGCNGGVLKVEASTSCGTATASATIPPGCAPLRTVVVFPNPTSSDIYVRKSQQSSGRESQLSSTNGFGTSPSTEEVSLELYDSNANAVRKKSFRGKKEEWRLDVSGIKKGTYVLKIVGKELNETHQIVVK